MCLMDTKDLKGHLRKYSILNTYLPHTQTSKEICLKTYPYKDKQNEKTGYIATTFCMLGNRRISDNESANLDKLKLKQALKRAKKLPN